MRPFEKNLCGSAPRRTSGWAAGWRGLAWLLLSTVGAEAAWSEVREGLDAKGVERQVGAPLIQSVVRKGALVTWTYDDGGYVLFEHGKVRFWSVPRAKK